MFDSFRFFLSLPLFISEGQIPNLSQFYVFCREWTENGQLWIQQVSSTPATRMDVVNLQVLDCLKYCVPLVVLLAILNRKIFSSK